MDLQNFQIDHSRDGKAGQFGLLLSLSEPDCFVNAEDKNIHTEVIDPIAFSSVETSFSLILKVTFNFTLEH